MRKQRRLLGILIAQPEAAYQKELLGGILAEAFRLDMDVTVFSTFVREGVSEAYMAGERVIYHLINYDLLDGIIIVPDTLRMSGLAEQVEDDIHKFFKGPVICVDGVSKYFTDMYNDDLGDIYDIVKHLVEVHQYKKIACITGTKDHPHAMNRLEGYKKALLEYGIPIREDWIYYGDFWYNKGEEFVELLLKKDEMPRAIVCTTDTMALSVYDALRKRGIMVPEEVAITGYDAANGGIDRPYFVTTKEKSNSLLGTLVIREIYKQLTGVEIPESQDEKQENPIIALTTCGCFPDENATRYISERVKAYNNVYDDIGFYSRFNFMLEDIISAPDIENYLWNVEHYTYFIENFDNFSLCFTDNWLEDIRDDDKNENEYTKKMYWVLETSKSRRMVDMNRTFDVEEMFPGILETRSEPAVFYFSPIHFSERNFGYAVLTYKNKPIVYNPSYCSWIRQLNNGLESQRRQINLVKMYQVMAENAVNDLLTGIYNRNGFNLYGEEMLKLAFEQEQPLWILIGDLNDLKYINDTYGHNDGDLAIKAAATAFSANVGFDEKKEKCFRIGGDEFVMLCVGMNDIDRVNYIKKSINKSLEQYNEMSEKPYKVHISLGDVYLHQVNEKTSIQSLIASADKLMFEEKRKHKKKKLLEKNIL